MSKELSEQIEEIVDPWEAGVEETQEEGPTELEDNKDEKESEDQEQKGEQEENLEDKDQSKEEKEEQEEPDDGEETVIAQLKNQFGYDDIEGEFEDTEDGVIEFTKQAAKRMADDFVDSTFDTHPVMKDFFEYVSSGGDPKNFINTKYPETDYNEVEFDENDVELQERLVKDELVASGYKGEELKAELKDIKDGGILESKAKRSLAKLKAKQQEDQNGILEQQRQQQQAETKQVQQFWSEVKDTIQQSKEFKGIRIPESDKSKFIDYLTKPIQDGKTKRDLDLEKAEMSDTLAIDYLFFKGFKLDDVISRKAKDLNAKSLKDRLTKAKLDKQDNNPQGGAGASTQNEELGEL